MQDLKKIEEETLKFWKDKKIYEKSKKKNLKGKKFYFLQGPPYTSGRLHIGHAWNNNMKDIGLRYFRLNGYNVWDRAGYDMHGLPTANKVQAELGLKDKEQIQKYSVEKFVKACKKFSVDKMKLMNNDLERMGIWMDFDDPYMPITNDFIEGEWALIKKAAEQKRLYKGKKIMHWDAQSETSLAKHELEYETVKDESIFLKFLKKGTQEEYFVIWTTTPWTIPFNLAIMVNPEIEYVKVRVGNEYWILASPLVNMFMGMLGEKYKIIKRFMGKELEGQEYVHPFYDELKKQYDELKKQWKNTHTVILSKEYVDTSSGSGLVHCAPGCGPEDQEAAKPYGLDVFNKIDERGVFEDMGPFTGMVAKEDDKKFIEALDKKGNLITTTEVEHEYPHSWRSHKPVVFRATEQWFLKIEDLVPKLLKFNEKVRWVPKKSGESYNLWTENLRDNALTRQRFWGCPMPVWVNVEDDKDYIVIGSIKELEKYVGKGKVPADLHRPYIDKVIIKKDNKEYKRVPDVIDVWIDSGTASWNCLYNNPKLIKEYFPADFVLEATEQTKLWFNMLQICSAIYFNKSCYENVFVHGMILDFQGTKMSKSLGNVISPYEVIDKYSSEVLRYYICENTAGENINFSWDDVKLKQRNLNVLMNIANFLIDLKTNKKPGKKGVEEKYILSRMNSTIQTITDLFENYELNKTITENEKLFLDLSRIYIKMIRDKEDKALVYEIIKEVYLNILKMFSTACPLITEHLWQKLRENKIVKEESVHLTDWPKPEKKSIDTQLEKKFESALSVIESGLAERDKKAIGLKWPLAKANISSEQAFSKEIQEIICSQLNVKELEIKISKELEVELDTDITPELEAEGFARNISRAVQALRKKSGLVKDNTIELVIVADSDLILRLENFKEMLKERTNAEEVTLTNEFNKDFTEDKLNLKNKEIKIFLKKVN